ncbi:MAG: potassium channel protein [Planctomycetota bacterium]|nr:potassium channel protein [Planctomycetota bacterium]
MSLRNSQARGRPIPRDAFAALYRSSLLVALTFVVGVVGYSVLGGEDYSVFDAVYMTVITLTTVGYGEVIDLTNNNVGRLFTTLLLLGGVGAFLNFFTSATAFVVEGHMQHILWSRRMAKAISKLNDHTIVCGGGSTGQHIIQELISTKRSFVLVDTDEQRIIELFERFDQEFPTVIGDATDDDCLMAGGIDRASGIVACLSNDKDNFIVTVSARLLRPDIRIICRCIDERVVSKIRKAGADSVVSPNRIGGLRMVSELARPMAVSYLDLMLREQKKNLRVESVEVMEGSEVADSCLGDLKDRKIKDLLVLAFRKADSEWHFAPEDETKIASGLHIIFMASPAARIELQRLTQG